MRERRVKSHLTWNYYHPEDKIEKYSNYHIHHINGNHNDNRIENLQKIEGRSHVSLHTKGDKNPMYKKPSYGFRGKKHTKETKNKLRELQLGKKMSNETRHKLSLANSGENNPFYGKHWDKVNRQRLRDNMLKRIERGEHPKGFKGKTHSDEYKKTLSTAMSKKIKYDNIIYSSIKEACKKTGNSYYIIRRKCQVIDK